MATFLGFFLLNSPTCLVKQLPQQETVDAGERSDLEALFLDARKMTEELRMRKDRDVKASGDVIDMTSCEDDDDDDGLYQSLSLLTACSRCEPVHQHADGMHT